MNKTFFEPIKNITKKHYLFILLIPIMVISQIYLLAPHLKYGLDGGDNGEILEFRQLRDKYPDNIQFVINSYKLWGIYSHQYYFLGILNYLFGTNFENYHIVSHVFKIIATLSIYPLFYFLSGSIAVAIIGTFFYSLLPSSIGSLDTLQHGSDYLAIPSLMFFLWGYIYLIKNNISSVKWITLITIFFLSSLAIATDRTFPLIILIPVIEAAWNLKGFSKSKLRTTIKRVGILLLPIFIALILQPSNNSIGAIHKLPENMGSHLKGLVIGRLDWFLIPFISFSSTFLPDQYWKLIGIIQTDNFAEYMINLLTIPMVIIFIPTLLIAVLLSKKPLRFIITVYLITIFGGIFTYFCSVGHQSILINQSIAGFYILGLAAGFLMEYLKNKSPLYFGLFFGPFVSFLFIVMMWLGTSEVDSVFKGIHKYLVVAAIFSCLFLGNIIVLLHKKIYQKKMVFKLLSLLPFLLFIQIIRLNTNEIKNYYNYYFSIGYGYEDQNKMRQLLLPYYQNLSLNNPRLIYIDVYTDSINTQYYSNTVAAGSNAWPIVWWTNLDLRPEIVPTVIIDYKALESGIIIKDNQKGIIYGQSASDTKFYKSENFFAVRFVSRQLIDITSQVKEELGLNE